MKSLSINYYFYILDRLESLGLDRQNTSEIVPLELQGQRILGTRLDVDSLYELFDTAQNELNIPHIGLNVSKSFRISNYGYAGNIFSACETIKEAILCAEKYGCLAHTLGQFREETNVPENSKWISYNWIPNFDEENYEKYAQITECVVGNYALTIKWLSWSFEGHIKKLTFRHDAVHPISQYMAILDCEVEFGAEHNSLLIDRAFVESPIPTANPLKLDLLKQKLNHLLAEYNQESDLIEHVEYAIKKVIIKERPTFSTIALELSLTERSLKRYLKKRNSSYREVLTRVKKDLCSIYSNQDVPLSEIAQRLWYADQSAFTRAYKNWYGVSPSKRVSH